MSDKDKKDDGEKKGGGMMGKLIFALVLIAIGGGGVFGLMAMGIIGSSEAVAVDNSPKLVRKEDDDPYAVPDADADATPYVFGEDGSEFRTTYFTFEDEFTSNLRNSNSLVQIAIAASTQRDGRVLMWVRKHELAIRSQLLIVLADTDETEFMTPEGKARLQERMAGSINTVLTDTEGYGGIDKVYFRSLIVQ